MPPETMNDLFVFLSSLMTSEAGLFESLGMNLFRSFAIILIVWFGVKVALAAASGGQTLPLDRFASLLMTIAFGYGMMIFYSRPIPGMGVSFYHLVVDQGTSLANTLNKGIMTEVWGRLNSIYFGTEQPALSLAINVMEILRYAVTVLALVAAEIAAFVVIAFGYIAAAVAVLLGPIFIPFFIVPQMEWMFWGWLKSLLQYSFYPVVANAYLFVFGQLLIHFVDSHPPPYDDATLAVLFLPLVFLLIAFTWGVLLIPSLVNSLFSGKSGESGMPSTWK